MTMLDKKVLIERIFDAEKAKLVKDWLQATLDKFDKNCYEQFKGLDINNYQDVDKSRIVMLKLEMKVIDNLKTELFNAITIGDEAMKKIKEYDRL